MARRGKLWGSLGEISSPEQELKGELSADGVLYFASMDGATSSSDLYGAGLQTQASPMLPSGTWSHGVPSIDFWTGGSWAVAALREPGHQFSAHVSAQTEGPAMTIQATPNDARYTDGSLWGMYGDASSPANQFGSQAAEAWAQGHTGSMTNVIGVIDSGIDYTHPDLYLNIWLNQREIPTTLRASLSDIDSDGLITFRDLNGAANASYVLDYNSNGRIDAGDLLRDARWENSVDEDGNGYRDDLSGWDFVNHDNDPMDDEGHGTHVAGTIGAMGGNGIGVAGVNWNVQLVPLQIFSATGVFSGDVAAVNYFTNAAVSARTAGSAENFIATNNSWGGGWYEQALLDAITAAARQDILFVAAAGNESSNNDNWPSYPNGYSTAPATGYEAVISVASITITGGLSDFSNFGVSSVDIAAPGSEIWSTLPNGQYETYGGTSMATPHVTGAIALYASLFPNATSAQIREALLTSATFTASLNNLVASDGRLNIPAMLAVAPPVTQFADWLDGSNNADNLSGLGGNDTLKADDGADTLAGGLGADSLIGGAGVDLVSYAGVTGAVTVNLANNRVSGAAGSDRLSGIENVLGGVGGDSLLGDGAANLLSGSDGWDILEGGAGADTLIGGSGTDRVSYAAATGAVTVSLVGGRAIGASGNDSLSGFENVFGGIGGDSLLGDAAANQLSGSDGADTLDGGAGTDMLLGDNGNDVFIVSDTLDLIIESVGGGADTIITSVSMSLPSNVEAMQVAAGASGLNIIGGAGNEMLFANGLSNTLNGGDGWDTMVGGAANDWLLGGAGVSQSVFLSAGQNPLPSFGIDFYAKPAFADLDNDGDLDLVVGRGDGMLSSFLRNSDGTYTPMDGVSGSPVNPFEGIDVDVFSAPSFTDFDLNGSLDLVVGRDDGTLAAYRRNVNGSYTPMDGIGGNPANPFSSINVGLFSAPCFNDIDLDGDQDLIVGGWSRLRAFMRNSDGSYTLMDGRFGNPLNPFGEITVGGYSTPSFVDLDFDGDADLVVGASDGTLAAFRRNANGLFSVMDGRNGNPANPFAGIDVGSNSSPTFADVNGDSILDLVVGGLLPNLSLYMRSSMNTSCDSLAGGNGADTIEGGGGADTVAGGSGDDLFITSDTLDIIIENLAEGTDKIITSVSISLPQNIEVLQIAAGVSSITVAGGAGNDRLIGNGLANNFNGGAGDDVILAGSATLADIYALFAT